MSRPWFHTTALYHWLLQVNMNRQYKPAPVSSKDKELFEEIRTNGFALVPNFLNAEQSSELCKEVESAYAKVKAENHPDYFCHDRGHERIGNIQEHVPLSAKLFYQNEMIWRLAQAYVSKNVKAYRKEADYKFEQGANYQANIAHFDDWRHRFKAFLFLHDVGEENAPMTYYRYSHSQKDWRKAYNLEFTTAGVDGRYGHFFPQEMDFLVKQKGLEAVSLTAKAGTLFLGDFRGIHQGTILQSGKRVLLNCTFGL